MENFRFFKTFILFGIVIIFTAGCRTPEITSPSGDTTIDAGDSISFTAETYPNAIYKWTFDGGAKDVLGQNPTVQFNISGVYYVCLTVVYEDLDSGFAALKVTVRDSSQHSGDTKYLAKNIVFNSDIVAKANVQADVIDTETQVLAENVIFENTDISQIESDNVQDALEEISLILSDVIVGTWDIQNYNQEASHKPTGKIVIYEDGTFYLIEGSFAAIGMGSGGGGMFGGCAHEEENQTYQIYTDVVVSFSYFIRTTPTHQNEISAVPRLVKLRENEITFVGHAGCGASSRQKISILTRVVD